MTSTAAPEAVTPTVRATLRRARFWIVAALVVAVIGIGTAVVNSTASLGGDFDPANPGPEGARALRSVLEQQGVRVRVTSTVAESGAMPGTLLIDDAEADLTPAAWRRLLDGRERVVVVSPGRAALDAVLPGTQASGRPSGRTASAGCDLPLAQRAGAMSLTGVRLSLRSSASTVCFSDGGGRAQLVAGAHDGVQVLLLADRAAFTNEHVAASGNAAVALGALGSGRDLVWFRQSPTDPAIAGAPSLQDLTPPWVTPLVALLLLGGLAAALWQGRRLGPIVVEALPVAVRSRETVEGRARLYNRGAARLHAADALRIGAIRRMAPNLGLSRTASVTEVIDATVRLTGRPRQQVEAVLLAEEPGGDGDLVRISDDLARLEAAVRAAAVPGASSSPTSPTSGDR
ncbi:DUF4350 domain-containing protein [Amnibacterium setariae]|uniref:DUF4350 domain-containing protein n=1 Tax=Amnibacterium setariae TaxID=2306585 RepID=A0A3A1TY80_9MICO|nr:DUF4350 domain-containing protein [Amnibacterium setariae]RIX28759.1 DUF4350 domain-containing protein [Amnibacterium setariae]